jgi:hypothetical protein
MYAFIKTQDGLYKIYNHDSDWQVIGPLGFERWFSIWTDDKKASLHRAVRSIPSSDFADLVICNDVS